MSVAILQQQLGRISFIPPPSIDPWLYWSPQTLQRILRAPIQNILIQWPFVVEQLHQHGIADQPVQIAALATIDVEAGAFWPVREAYYLGEPEPAETWRRRNLRYYPYYGRGLIQLTWMSNYARYSPLVSSTLGRYVDLVTNMDDALLTDVSAAVLAWYFMIHRYPSGYGIPEAARAGDWQTTRILVNGGLTGYPEYIATVRALEAAA